MNRFTTPIMIFALTLGFQAAEAAAPQDVPSTVVRFADLDLSSSEGAKVLYQRLKGAADMVCAPLSDRRLELQTKFKACQQSAISAAVAKVDQPALTRYYEAKSHVIHPTLQVAQK